MPSETVFAVKNEVKSALNLAEPTPELLEWAKENIGEDPETRDQVLSDFRDMIFARGECNPHRTDDAYLLKFLRARNFIVERAHRLMCNYYDFKENNPQFFKGIKLKHLKKFGEFNIITVPPYREQTGRRLLIYRLGNWDPQILSTDAIFQATLIILELAILEPQQQILGGIVIFDLGGLSMQQAWHMNPTIAHLMVQIMVTSFPIKVHALHVVNQPWLFDMIFNLFKPFISDKMKERIFFHGEDMDSLHQHIDPKHLSEVYGGVHPEYNYNDWMDHFYGTEAIVRELKSLGYKDDSEEDSDDDDDEKKSGEESE